MKIGRVTCTAVNGQFKGKQIEIQIGEHASETKVLVEGKEYNGIYKAKIVIEAGVPTKVLLETYA